jgi:hypothetical protein
MGIAPAANPPPGEGPLAAAQGRAAGAGQQVHGAAQRGAHTLLYTRVTRRASLQQDHVPRHRQQAVEDARAVVADAAVLVLVGCPLAQAAHLVFFGGGGSQERGAGSGEAPGQGGGAAAARQRLQGAAAASAGRLRAGPRSRDGCPRLAVFASPSISPRPPHVRRRLLRQVVVDIHVLQVERRRGGHDVGGERLREARGVIGTSVGCVQAGAPRPVGRPGPRPLTAPPPPFTTSSDTSPPPPLPTMGSYRGPQSALAASRSAAALYGRSAAKSSNIQGNTISPVKLTGSPGAGGVVLGGSCGFWGGGGGL